MNITLHDAQQAWDAINQAWKYAKPLLLAGHRLMLTVKPATRSLEQNAKFHAICDDLSKSGMKWAGKARSAEEWKILLVSGHSVATRQPVDIVPGLEGEFINLRESTARMSVKRSASLIEYTLAFCAMNGVRLSAPEREEVVA